MNGRPVCVTLLINSSNAINQCCQGVKTAKHRWKPRLARDLTQVLFLACSTILLCIITWNGSMVQWLHGTHQSCHFVFVCLFVLFCFLLLFFLFPKNYKNWNSTNFKQFWTDYTFEFNNTFYYCIVWHMYVQVKYFFFLFHTKENVGATHEQQTREYNLHV